MVTDEVELDAPKWVEIEVLVALSPRGLWKHRGCSYELDHEMPLKKRNR